VTIPHRGGLPHSDIHGSTPARGSPWLFAACHVLHRLLVPRHPPNALLSLEIIGPRPRGTSPGKRAQPPCAGTIHRMRPDTAATRSAHNRIPIRQSRRRANADTPPNGTHAPERLRRRRWHPLAENTGQTLATAARPGTHQNLINTDKRTTVPNRRHNRRRPLLHATRPRRNSLLLCDTVPAIGTHQLSVPAIKPSEPAHGGDDRIRTDDPLLAKQVLSQLSYAPSQDDRQPSMARKA
jgi:hypothetical protein